MSLLRILRALHTALGRWLAEADQPAVKRKTNRRGSDKPRARGAKRGDRHTAETIQVQHVCSCEFDECRKHELKSNQYCHNDRKAPSTSERKGTSWFDCDPEQMRAVAPRDPEEEEAEAWYRAHFRNWPGRR